MEKGSGESRTMWGEAKCYFCNKKKIMGNSEKQQTKKSGKKKMRNLIKKKIKNS